MRRGEWAAHPAISDQNRKRDVVRTAELESLGVPRRTIYRRCLPGGPWRWLLRGIILLYPGEPTRQQLVDAALLYGGRDALITGLWAARRFGLKRTPEPSQVHILVPNARELTSSGFVTVERTTRLPGAVVRAGVPLAPVHRAILDAARRMRNFDVIRAMLAEAVQRRFCAPADLRDELDRGSQRGSALPRRAMGELMGGAHSVAEGDGVWLWKRAGLPPPQRNVRLYDANGRYIGTPDGWLDKVALAWEIDSKECHFDVDGYAATLARNARYAAAGIVLLQTLPSRIRREPAAVIRELRAAYEAACRRPRPPIRVAA